jgi:hypothetical protein
MEGPETSIANRIHGFYTPTMTTTLFANGLIEIPEVFRKVDALKTGQQCDIERVGQGHYQLRVSTVAEASTGNWVEWLLACPEKGWFVEPERGEMTSLQPPTLFAE